MTYDVYPREPSKFMPGDTCGALYYTRKSLELYDSLETDGWGPVTILDHAVVLSVPSFARFIAEYTGGSCSVRDSRGRRESCVWVDIGNNCHSRVYCVESCSLPEYDAVCNWKPLKG